jgi:hypothetical protein
MREIQGAKTMHVDEKPENVLATALSLRLQNRPVACIEALSAGAICFPTFKDTHGHRAFPKEMVRTLANLERYDDAMGVIREFDLTPDEYLVLMARAYEANGRGEEAFTWWSKVRAVMPRHPECEKFFHSIDTVAIPPLSPPKPPPGKGKRPSPDTTSPYANLPARSFWSSGVAKSQGPVPDRIYAPKWQISPDDKIATAGSCFAQHIGRKLKEHKFQVLDVEPPPPALEPEFHHQYGYSLYSARYGNIYTVRQLLQLAQEAFGEIKIQTCAWESAIGAFYDALRPSVEPEGLSSELEVKRHREYHLSRVRKLFSEMTVFFFTMGLTEAYMARETGIAYPVAPGVIAGEYSRKKYVFKNFQYDEILSDFLNFRGLIKRYNRHEKLKFLVTVSPVPLTATATDDHVMVATMHSKAILRAVTGALHDRFGDIDYFPSYEIVSNPWSHFDRYESNQRSVKSSTVAAVMHCFLDAHGVQEAATIQTADLSPAQTPVQQEKDDLVCEEAMLDAFTPVDSSTQALQS